jgi:tetratricopeptide (TPR) repeat protein
MNKSGVRHSEAGKREVAGARERESDVRRPTSGFRVYHILLLAALGVLVGAQYWLGRQMFEQYRFNLLRHPQLAQETPWARMTRGMPAPLREKMTRTFLGALPEPPPAMVSEYVERLRKLAAIFPHDGILQLELARQLVEQAKRRRGPVLFEQASDLFRQALEHNRRAFETYFDVETYGQTAWIHMELHGLQLAAKRKAEADVSLRKAIDGFHRVLIFNPGDRDALEHLAYLYSYVASASKRREDWLVSLDYAKRLLEAQHDNTNAFYFIGIAYENLELTEQAMMYYLKTLTYPSTLPPEKRMWDRKIILDHLNQLGYTRPVPPAAPAKKP